MIPPTLSFFRMTPAIQVPFCCSVTQSYPPLCEPKDCLMPGFPHPSLSPGACSNSCPLHRRCHPTISSPVVPFSSCPQSSPASRSFPVSPFFPSGGQRIRASTSASYKFGEILVCIYKKNLKPVYHFRENGHRQSVESQSLNKIVSHLFRPPLSSFLHILYFSASNPPPIPA